jgi:hypothetical protein
MVQSRFAAEQPHRLGGIGFVIDSPLAKTFTGIQVAYLRQ